MFEKIKLLCDQLQTQFDQISPERKVLLQQISQYIQRKHNKNEEVNLLYVCTHNSRRSHFGQVWGAVAAAYYGIENVSTFSGGTEATAFNPNAINALRQTGFEIMQETVGPNSEYKVQFGQNNEFTNCFSKVYYHEVNPRSQFAAIMTCSDAEENCPFIPGAELRIAITYQDPKAFDGMRLQEEMYIQRATQIALESLYIFSEVKEK